MAKAEPGIVLFADKQLVSPYAMSVAVALAEKGLKYELRRVDLHAKENLDDTYRTRSLTSRVPTLVHGSFSLSESSAIDEYLEDVFPPPEWPAIYPFDLERRARARQVQAWVRSDLMPLRIERNTTVVFFGARLKPLSVEAQESAMRLFTAVQSMLPMGAENLFGDWCIADTDLALMLNRLAMHEDVMPDRLAEYARHQWKRPSVQAFLALEREPAVPVNTSGGAP
jgi:glutathione S-transferase